VAADPARPGYTQAGDQMRGNPAAPVTVIEISDFQCPFCRRHVEQTQPQLEQAFVESGQVRWVFRHFPLNGHAQAEAAGVAAECAGEQGEFWAMHDLLFTQVERWAIADAAPIFRDLAQQLDLDAAQFTACLADETIRQRVQTDREESAAFVQGTPTFVIRYGDEQRVLPGALPADRFMQVLQQAVDAVAQ
jgi:protein-disulfide isomerase